MLTSLGCLQLGVKDDEGPGNYLAQRNFEISEVSI